jgi:protein-S-isoprenylcysteine O-methyltransferase Ste14
MEDDTVSYTWLMRVAVILGLFIYLILSRTILRERKKYHTVLESGPLNFVLIFIYNTLCYLAVGIRSDPHVIEKPPVFETPLVANWYSIVGQIFIVGSVLVLIIAVIKRKAIGAQDTDGRLLTSGIYSFTRHPIYVGIVLIALGIAIVRTNFDGMIVFPLVFVANILQAKLEEIHDVGVRFKEEYQQYKKQTCMFGPLWFWIVIALLLIVPLIISFTQG